MIKNKNKKVEEREIVVTTFRKEIKKQGNGAHIQCSKNYIGLIAEVKVISKIRMCERCSEIYLDDKSFSEDKRYCIDCFNALKYIRDNKNNLKCKKCGKKITEKEFKEAWDTGFCVKCELKRPIPEVDTYLETPLITGEYESKSINGMNFISKKEEGNL